MKHKFEFINIKLFPKWTIRKMAFVAILIAISVAFTVVSAQIVPLITLSSYKIAFIGLPVKIAGFIFGPFVGFFVGVVSDLLSLLFIPPAGYSPVYTLAVAMNGIVAGIFGYYFMQFTNRAFSTEYRLAKNKMKIHLYVNKYKNAIASNNNITAEEIKIKLISLYNKQKFITPSNSQKLLANISLVNGVVFLSIILVIILTYISLSVTESDLVNSLVKSKKVLTILMNAGLLAMIVFIIIGRFTLKLERYTVLVPIIVFSAFLELINLPILSYGDMITLSGGSGGKEQFFFWISQHILSSPIKIWFNMFVIYYSYLIVSKLINKNEHLKY
ncbi:ECF transporter S component [Mycoplasma buteonis]|uniref:ECF transporter S component n=1 Tax=Mycoplasma buteonis TaxID=171280 RepID=UPI000A62C48E|nr:ECF transporter S component [Mycoplasma buteonis]